MAVIVPLTSAHANDAARLHIAGQPGTFLTALGPAVLTVLYHTLPQSPVGFGFAAVDETAPGRVLGFVSATSSVGKLFVEMGTRRLGQFLPPLLAQLVRRPSLLIRCAQTLAYPLLVHPTAEAEPVKSAELLSIMVESSARGSGIGTELLRALFLECQARKIARLDVTVDAANDGARRFYEQHGFTLKKSFLMYNREMCLYTSVCSPAARSGNP